MFLLSQGDGSQGKGTCHQAWLFELDSILPIGNPKIKQIHCFKIYLPCSMKHNLDMEY